MRNRDRAWVADLRALAILAILSVGFLWRCNLGGKVLLPADLLLIMEPWKHYSRQFPEFQRVGNPILDAVQQSYPWRRFAGAALRSGEIPLWNPYVLCGNSFIGNNQSALFYPETWLHALMPTERALGWATSLHFFLSGALMYWFLRVLALRRWACIFGAVAFMFNGFVIGWVCLPAFRSVPGWLPGMLAAFEMSRRTRRPGWAALCALFVGLQFLAGNLHISLYVLLAFAAYVIFRCGCDWASRARDRIPLPIAYALGALAVGGLLAAVQLVPVLELVGMSSRAGAVSYSALLQNGLPWQNLLTALMPDVLGNPADGNHWGAHLGKVYRAYTESAFYVGVMPVLLLPAALLTRRREAGFWLGLAVAAMLLALGTHLNAILYYLVPGFDSLSGIGRAVILTSTALAVIGALGLDGLAQLAEDRRPEVTRRALIGGIAIALVGLVGGLWMWALTGPWEQVMPGVGSYTLLQILRFAAVAVVGLASAAALMRWRRPAMIALTLCLAADMFIFVDGFVPATNPAYLQIRPRCLETVRSAPGHPRVLSLGEDGIRRMAPNTAMIAWLEDIQGSDSLEIGAYRRLLNAMCTDELGFEQPDPALPIIDLLGVRFVHSSIPLEGIPKLQLVSDYDGYLYENVQCLPRAFIAPEHETATDRRALGAVLSPGFRPAKKVWPAQNVTRESGRGGGRATAVTTARHDANAVLLTARFEPGQLVVLADAFYPGWRAYQGSAELPIIRADYALRAVQTASDESSLRFLYVPGSFWVGGFITLLAAGFLTALAVASGLGGGGRQ